MKKIIRLALFLLLPAVVLAGTVVTPAGAVQNPQNGSLGLEATIPSAPPTQAATITTPSNGAVFTSIPITVGGLCPSGLLIKVFANGVFVGSTVCANGSYQLKVDLFGGRNDLIVRDYDSQDQAGPDSNLVTVTFNDSQFGAFGSRVTLSSNYARRGANPGDELDWPISIAGGTPPYALSVDWGDGKSDLYSESFADVVTIKHTYSSAGTYTIIVRASDSKGSTAFLQLVGVANGALQSGPTSGTSKVITKTKIIWWPAVVALPLLLITFWLGQRHELYTLRKHLEEQ
jgi:hypothetical protein